MKKILKKGVSVVLTIGMILCMDTGQIKAAEVNTLKAVGSMDKKNKISYRSVAPITPGVTRLQMQQLLAFQAQSTSEQTSDSEKTITKEEGGEADNSAEQVTSSEASSELSSTEGISNTDTIVSTPPDEISTSQSTLEIPQEEVDEVVQEGSQEIIPKPKDSAGSMDEVPAEMVTEDLLEKSNMTYDMASIGPYNLRVVSKSNESITLEWDAQNIEGITYNVQVNDNLAAENLTKIKYKLENLQPGTIYHISVQAVAPDGTKDEMSEVLDVYTDLIITESTELEENQVVGDVYLQGGLYDLNGYQLTVTGNMIHSGGTLFIDEGILEIQGDYRQQTVTINENNEVTYSYSNGYLRMNSDVDCMKVKGNFVVDSQYTQTDLLSGGTIEIGGNFIQCATQNSQNFMPTRDHTIIFNGEGDQNIAFASTNSYFNHLKIEGSKDKKVTIANRLIVNGALSDTSVNLINSKNIVLGALGILAEGTWNYDLTFAIAKTLSQDMCIAGNVYVEANLDLNESKLEIGGNLTQTGGTLNITKGNLIIGQNYASSGRCYLRMVDEGGYMLVKGGFTHVAAYSHNGYMTNGVLEVKGNFTETAGYYYYSYYHDNFYGTEAHKVILSGDGKQVVDISGTTSRFNILELNNYSSEGISFKQSLKANIFISNDCKYTLPGSEIEGWTLEEDTQLTGDIYLGVGELNLNGHKLIIEGNLIQSAGKVNVNGGYLEVQGDYLLRNTIEATDGTISYSYSNGYLIMTNEMDYVKVNGDFVMQSQYSHQDKLTAGTLEVKGNFTQLSYNTSQNFLASGNHTVLLSGVASQTVSFESTGSYFYNLKITNTSAEGVTFDKRTYVYGALYDTTTPIKGSNNLGLGASGILADGTWQYDLVFNGNRNLYRDISIKGNLYIESNLCLNNHKATIGGNVLHTGGTLELKGQLYIDGNYQSSGRVHLIMRQEADYMLVKGDFTDAAAYGHNGYMTNGVLEIKGDFTETAGYYYYSYYQDNFCGTDKHKVILSGEDKQVVDMQGTTSRFNILELKNNSSEGVTFKQTITITQLITNGCKYTFAGGEVSGWTLEKDTEIEGDLCLGTGELDLNGHKLIIKGNLIQAAGTIAINGGYLEVQGDYLLRRATMGADGIVSYSYSNGYLIMTNEMDYVKVNGDFIMQSQYSHQDKLTAGTLEVKGDFTQLSYNTSQNFLASGKHTVLLSGVVSQTVSFESTGSYFYNLKITNTSAEGVTFDKRTYVYGALYDTTTPIKGSNNLGLGANGILADGTWQYDLVFNGNRNLDRDISIKGNLYIESNLCLNNHKATIGGNVSHTGGTLELKGQLYIDGNYQSSGRVYLIMRQEADYMLVKGDFTDTAAYSHNGYMTNGVLEIKGNFTEAAGYYYYSYYQDNFYGTGNHKVILSGEDKQVIDMQGTTSRFNILELKNNSSEGVTFKQTITITQLITNGCKYTFAGGEVAGWTLEKDTEIDGDLCLGTGKLDLNGYKLIIKGNLIHAAGTIAINGGYLEVQSNYLLRRVTMGADGAVSYSYSNGYLIMTNEKDYVKVEGDFVMQSQYSHQDKLTAGTLEVKGDFTQLSYNTSQNFLASGKHTVLLSGTTSQTVSFESTGSYFYNLKITNTSAEGVTFDKRTYVCGALYDTTTPIKGSNNLGLGANGILADGTWQYDLVFNGNRNLDRDISIKGNLYIESNLCLNNHKATIGGNVSHTGGTLELKGQLYIDGNYQNSSRVYLIMRQEADYMLVKGDFTDTAAYSHNGYMTNGVLEIKGNFTEAAGYYYYSYYHDNFYGTGNHKVILSGEVEQVVDMQGTTSRFNILELKNYSSEGVTFKKSLNATKFITNNCKYTMPNGELEGWTLSADQVYYGDLYLGAGVLDLNGHKLTVKGNLLQSAGTININGGYLEVQKDYRIQTPKVNEQGLATYEYSKGYLNMTGENDYVYIGKNFVMHSIYSHNGKLTAGTIEIKGDFTQLVGNQGDNFKPTGKHTVLLTGSKEQIISFANTSSVMNNLIIENTSAAGVKLANTVIVNNSISNEKTVLVNSKNFTLPAQVIIEGDYWNGDLTFSGYKTLSSDLVVTGSVYLQNGMDLNGHYLKTGKDVYLTGGTLLINRGNLQVGKNFNLTGWCILKMLYAEDYILVKEHFITNARYNHSGYLVAGTLEVQGNLTETVGYYNHNFYCTGDHITILSGDTKQKVTINDANSMFNTLVLTKPKATGYTFNREPMWNTLIEQTEDEAAPEAPVDLTFKESTVTTILLSWEHPSAEDVYSYGIFRDGVRVGYTTTKSYRDTGLTANTSYTYMVVAYSKTMKESKPSEAVIASTAKDEEAPTTPANLKITSKTANSVKLSWSAAIDNIKVVGYHIYRDETLIGTSTGTSYEDTGIASGDYTYTVTAYDAVSNESAQSNAVVYDNEAPEIVTLSIKETTTTSVTLMWEASKDNIGVVGYAIYRDDNSKPIKTVTGTQYTDVGVDPNTQYSYYVKAYDAAGNYSKSSNIVSIQTVPDTQAPLSVKELKAVSRTGGSITLKWQASDDNICVIGYRIYRDGKVLSESNTLTYVDTDVVLDTEYTYTVTAYDAAGNESEVSKPAVSAAILPEITEIRAKASGTLGGTTAQPIYILFKDAGNTVGASVKLEILKEGTWEVLDTISKITETNTQTAYFTYNWDLTNLTSGTYSLKAIVYDAAGYSSGEMIKDFSVDRGAPEKLINVTAEGGKGKVTLNWTKSEAEDFVYYRVYRSQKEDSEFTVVGMVLKDKAATYIDNKVMVETPYYYYVTAVDCFDQESEPSEIVQGKASYDDTPGNVYISEIGPNGGYYNKQIDFTVKAGATKGLTQIILERSYDKMTWEVIESKELTNKPTNYTWQFTVDVNSEVQGKVYYRAGAKDYDGLSIPESQKTVIYNTIDRMSPPAVTNITGQLETTTLTVSWQPPSICTDIAGYKVMKAVGETGEFKTLGTLNSSQTSFTEYELKASEIYRYKVYTVDLAGNISENYALYSTSTLEDTMPPVITKISWDAQSEIDITDILSVYANDDYWLSSIWVEGKSASDIDYTVLSKRDFTRIKEAGVNFKLSNSNLKEEDYYVRIVAEDLTGNKTTSKVYTVHVDKTGPINVTVKTETVEEGIKLTLGCSESNVTYKIYRSENGTRRLMMSGKDNTYIDKDVRAQKVYSYSIIAIDSKGNASEEVTVSQRYEVDDKEPPVIVVYNLQNAIVGEPFTLDASNSTDNGSIKSYEWTINNKVVKNGAKVTYTFEEEGTYTISLVVEDEAGNISKETFSLKAMYKEQLGKVIINVINAATGSRVSDTSIYIASNTSDVKESIFYAEGVSQVAAYLTPDNYSIAAFSKSAGSGSDTFIVKAGETVELTVKVEEEGIIKGEVTVRPLTIDELKKAGVDLSDPNNYQSYEVEIDLGFNKITTVVNSNGNVLGGNAGGGGGWGSSGPGFGSYDGFGGCSDGKYQYTIKASPAEDGNIPTIYVLKVPLETSLLKEFFEVKLEIINKASEEISLEDIGATLDLPSGLSLATTNPAQSMFKTTANIVGGKSGTITWIIRGDQEGEYNVGVNVNGVLMPFNVAQEYCFKTTQPVKVWGSSAIEAEIIAQDKAFSDEYYLLKYNFKNISDKPMYNFSVEPDKSGIESFAKEVIEENKQEIIVAEFGTPEYFVEGYSLEDTAFTMEGDKINVTKLEPGQSISGYMAIWLNFTSVEFAQAGETENTEDKTTEYSIPTYALKYLLATSDSNMSIKTRIVENKNYHIHLTEPDHIEVFGDYPEGPFDLEGDVVNKENEDLGKVNIEIDMPSNTTLSGANHFSIENLAARVNVPFDYTFNIVRKPEDGKKSILFKAYRNGEIDKIARKKIDMDEYKLIEFTGVTADEWVLTQKNYSFIINAVARGELQAKHTISVRLVPSEGYPGKAITPTSVTYNGDVKVDLSGISPVQGACYDVIVEVANSNVEPTIFKGAISCSATYVPVEKIEGQEITLLVGEKVLAENCINVFPKNASNKFITSIKSNNTKIADVDSYGNIIGESKGNTTIHAIGQEGQECDIAVTVTDDLEMEADIYDAQEGKTNTSASSATTPQGETGTFELPEMTFNFQLGESSKIKLQYDVKSGAYTAIFKIGKIKEWEYSDSVVNDVYSRILYLQEQGIKTTQIKDIFSGSLVKRGNTQVAAFGYVKLIPETVNTSSGSKQQFRIGEGKIAVSGDTGDVKYLIPIAGTLAANVAAEVGYRAKASVAGIAKIQEGKIIPGFKANAQLIGKGGLCGQVGFGKLSLVSISGGVQVTLDITMDRPDLDINSKTTADLIGSLYIDWDDIITGSHWWTWDWAKWPIYPKSNARAAIAQLRASDMKAAMMQDNNEQQSQKLERSNNYIQDIQVVPLSNNKELAVWIENDTQRDNANAYALKYAIKSNETWSTVKYVDDDQTADFSPKLVSNGDKAWVVWQNEDTVFEKGNVSLQTYVEHADMTVMEFKDDSFINKTNLTKNYTGQTSIPCIAMNENNQVSVVWVDNNGSDLNCLEGTNNIIRCQYNGKEWTKPEAIATKLPILGGLDVGYDGKNSVVALSLDADSDIDTVSDRDIYFIQNNELIQVTNDEQENVTPVLIQGKKGLSAVWNTTSGASYMEDIKGELIVDIAEGQPITRGFKAASNDKGDKVLYWTTGDTDTNNVVKAVFFNHENEEWSKAVDVVKGPFFVGAYNGYLDNDNNLEMLLARKDNVQSDSSTLTEVQITPRVDLAVEKVASNDMDVKAGDEVEIYAQIKNLGTKTISNVNTQLIDSNNTVVNEEMVEVKLVAGDEQYIQTNYTLPSEFNGGSYTMKVMPVNAQDDDESNNVYNVRVGMPRLIMSQAQVTGDKLIKTISVEITNTGYWAVEDVDVQLLTDLTDGQMIDVIHIDSLPARGKKEVQFNVSLGNMEVNKAGNKIILYIVPTTTDANVKFIDETYACIENPYSNVPFTVMDVTKSENELNVVLQNSWLSVADGVLVVDIMNNGKVIKMLTRDIEMQSLEEKTYCVDLDKLVVEENQNIRVFVADKDDKRISNIIELGGKAGIPYTNIKSGSYVGEQLVSIFTMTEGADIFYTTDGSIPTTASKKYSEPIIIRGDMDINAIATQSTMRQSEMASFNYSVVGDGDKPSEGDKPGQGDKPNEGDKLGQGDKPNEGDKPGQGDKPNEGDKPGQGDKSNEGDKPGQGDKPNEGDKPSQGDKPEGPGSSSSGNNGDTSQGNGTNDAATSLGGGGSSHNNTQLSLVEAYKALSEKEQQALAKYLNEYMPYTIKSGKLDESLLAKLTLNYFTKEQLTELVNSPELFKDIGMTLKEPFEVVTLNKGVNKTFIDVKDDHWAKDAIKEAVTQGVAQGISQNEFAPSKALQVADTCTFLDRMLLLKDQNNKEMKLTRSTVEKYVTNKAHWAFYYEASTASKLSEVTLNRVMALGEKSVSREILAEVLYEVTDKKLPRVNKKIDFTDIPNTSAYKEAIDYCVQVGLLIGTSKTTMSPNKAVTRAELMTILMRLEKLL